MDTAVGRSATVVAFRSAVLFVSLGTVVLAQGVATIKDQSARGVFGVEIGNRQSAWRDLDPSCAVAGEGEPKAPERRPRTADPQAKAVVEAYLRAIGGRDALAAIQIRYEEYTEYVHGGNSVVRKNCRRFVRRDPWSLKEEYQAAETYVTSKGDELWVRQVYDGRLRMGWTCFGGSESGTYVYALLEESDLYGLVWDKYVDDFFMWWQEDGYSLSYEGTEESDNRRLHVVEARGAVGGTLRCYFDDETRLLQKTRRDTKKNVVGGMVVYKERCLSDWRRIPSPRDASKSVLLPFRVQDFRAGVLAIETHVTKVQLNCTIDQHTFTCPRAVTKPFTPSKTPRGAVRARHILFPQGEEGVASEVLARLATRELTWEDALLYYSVDVVTKRAGGDLGWADTGESVPAEIRDLALRAKSGERIPATLLKGTEGWHIIEVFLQSPRHPAKW